MSATTLNLRGTHVATDGSNVRWIVAAEYEIDGRLVVDLTGSQSGRVVRKYAVDLDDLCDPKPAR